MHVNEVRRYREGAGISVFVTSHVDVQSACRIDDLQSFTPE